MESNVRMVSTEYKDPYTALVLRNIYINDNVDSTTSATVEVLADFVGTPTHYRIGESADLSTFEWLTWNYPSGKIPFVMSSALGQKTVYVQLKDSNTESGVKVDTITYLSPYVVLSGVSINGGAQNTSNSIVDVSFQYSGAPTHYILSEDPTFVGAQWIAYADGTVNYQLSAGFGNKTVYAKLKDQHRETDYSSDSIELVAQDPVKTIISLAGVAKIVTNPTVNAKIINVISMARNETFPNLQLQDSSGNKSGSYLCKPSSYPTGIPGLVDNRFSPALNDSGAYPAVYINRYVTGSNVTSESSPAMFRFAELSAGTYTVRILSSGDNSVSIPSDKWINVFYGANLAWANLTYDVVNNKDKFVEIENVVVKDDGILDIKLWLTVNMSYRPGVNLIEIIRVR